MNNQDQVFIFEFFREGCIGYSFLEFDVLEIELEELLLDIYICDEDVELLEVFELDIMCYYIVLFKCNYGVDFGFYLFGFCIMKYNLKINEKIV